MIFESYPWKREIERHLRLLRRWSASPASQRAEFYIQRAVLISAFAMRKLMENRKLTDTIRDRSIGCRAYRPYAPISGRVSTFAGLTDVGDDYDLTEPEIINISCFDLMSEIIHSYVFKLVLDEQASVVAFMINSYKQRDARLLEIDRDRFEGALVAAIEDRVMEVQIVKHASSGKILARVLDRKSKRN